MAFHVLEEHLNGIMVLKNVKFLDHRGYFMEAFRKDEWDALVSGYEFLQDNQSGSAKDVLRGLHFQWDRPMGKLIRIVSGEAFVVAVDIRKESPTVGKWYGRPMSADSQLLLWAPPGFATGFCVTSAFAEVLYKCTAIYNPKAESGIAWNDSAINIKWPLKNPILSEKDRAAQTLAEWLDGPYSNAFRYIQTAQ